MLLAIAARFIGLILLVLSLVGFSLPASALSKDAQFEAKVLQVLRENPETIIQSLQAYQQKQRDEQQKRQQAFLGEMKANPKGVIGSSPTKGAATQDIVLVLFSDFQCPYCATVRETLKQFMLKHGDRVTLAYKNLPLTEIHQQALPAAFSAWAAGQQGKFWEYYEALFAQQKSLGEPLYQATAKALGLDLERFERDRSSDAAGIALGKDIEMARMLAIEGTPFLVMNGEAIPGAVELADLEAVFKKVSASI